MGIPVPKRLLTFCADDRAMSQRLAIAMLLGSALVLAGSLAVFMLAGG